MIMLLKQEKQLKYWGDIIAVQDQLKASQNRLCTLKEKLAETHKHYKELEEQTNRDTTQVWI